MVKSWPSAVWVPHNRLARRSSNQRRHRRGEFTREPTSTGGRWGHAADFETTTRPASQADHIRVVGIGDNVHPAAALQRGHDVHRHVLIRDHRWSVRDARNGRIRAESHHQTLRIRRDSGVTVTDRTGIGAPLGLETDKQRLLGGIAARKDVGGDDNPHQMEGQDHQCPY